MLVLKKISGRSSKSARKTVDNPVDYSEARLFTIVILM